MSLPQNAIELAAYLKRIGHCPEVEPSPAVLRSLHMAHAQAIPFENIEVLLGGVPRLDPAGLQLKLVEQRRGGYCFEQNSLLALMLEAIGFGVRRLSARVRWHGQHVLPRTHMLLLVSAGQEQWLADVGFGAHGLLEPLPFREGAESRVGLWTTRLVREGELWVLQIPEGGDWRDLYAFDLQEQQAVDMELANWYTATHPGSIFRKGLIAQRVTPERRTHLRDRELSVEDASGISGRSLRDEAEVRQVLEEIFGIQWPTGATSTESDTAGT
ncbi:MAG: arylamine N-acetyltransferase [Candidatus Cloacimonetes bacterium]|nr:arylamine N-acetyltransferase [Candidatus Cloacimonadota bacterium]